MRRRTFKMEDAVALPVLVEVAVSPRGQGVAVVVQRLKASTQDLERAIVWLADGEPVLELESSMVPWEATRIEFSPDGRFLAWISYNAGHATNGGASMLQILDVESQRSWGATPEGHQVIDYDWAPSGQTLFYIGIEDSDGRSPNKRPIRSDAIVHMGEVPSRSIWSLSVPEGLTTWVASAGRGASELAVSHDGEAVAYVSNHTGLREDARQSDVFVHWLTHNTTHQITASRGAKDRISWAIDDRHITFRSGRSATPAFSKRDLHAIEVAEPNRMTNLTSATNGDVVWHRWIDATTFLVALEQGTATRLYRVSGDEWREVCDGMAFNLSTTAQWLGYLSESHNGLPEAHLLDLSTGVNTKLSDYTATLALYELPQVQLISWKGALDDAIEGVLTLPEGPSPHPLILALHGGPHNHVRDGLHHYANIRAKALASHGYAVLQPNYHGSSAYGDRFAASLYREIGHLDYIDAMTGVDYLVAEGIADSQRLGVMGTSYGGYLTNWIVGHTRRFRAAVSQFGVWDLRGDFGTTSEDLWTLAYSGSFPWEDPEFYRLKSPSTYAAAIETPVLIMHGESDENVFISNSLEMWHTLHHLGQTVEFIRYPREGHGFAEPAHVIDELQRVTEWFDRYLRKRSINRPVPRRRP